MAKYYQITVVAPDLIRGKFGPEEAENDAIAAELDATLAEMVESGELGGGPYVLKFNGPASIQVASVLTHRLGHLYAAFALRDPKMFVEDPNGLDFVVAPGTKWERKLRVRGQEVNGRVIPDPVFVVTVAHGGRGYEVGDVIS